MAQPSESPKRLSLRPDVVIAGGGPSGLICALVLARLGHSVSVIWRTRMPNTMEVLAPRTVDTFKSIGCQHALAACQASGDRESHWNGSTATIPDQVVVDRAALDEALRLDAKAAGVMLMEGSVGRCDAKHEDWIITWRDKDDHARTSTGRFFVEARGREAPVGGAQRVRGPAISSLSQLWVSPRGYAQAKSALVSFADGWSWFASAGEGRAVLQFVLATDKGRASLRSNIEKHYHELIEQLADIKPWLADAFPEGLVVARGAAPYLVTPTMDSANTNEDLGKIRIGDANAATDPLGNHGLFDAINSAIAAVPAIHTWLTRPENRDIACDYIAERTLDSFYRATRTSRDHYRSEQRWARRSFWQQRSDWPDNERAQPHANDFPPKVEVRPVVKGSLVENEKVLVTGEHPRGIWRIAGVPLLPLVTILQTEGEAQAAEKLAAKPESIAAAVKWLRLRGLVRRKTS